MRTTLSLDEDVMDKARALANRSRKPFRVVVNEALRAGLDNLDKASRARPYKTRARPMGLKPGRNLDNIQDLIAQTEGEDHR